MAKPNETNDMRGLRADAASPMPTTDARGRRSTRARERASRACLGAATALSAALGLAHPATAYADIDVSGTLTQVLNMLANGIVLLGGILVVMGLVSLGMSLKDGMRGGSELSSALAMIVGGIVVSAAGAYFRSLDTNITG